MPESHKAEKRRIQKANVVAGIGDATGRIPMRVKADVKMMKCSKCSSELKVCVGSVCVWGGGGVEFVHIG